MVIITSETPTTSDPAEQQPQTQSSHRGPDTLIDGVHALPDSDTEPKQVSQKQDTESSGLTDQLLRVPSCSCPVNGNEQVVITVIRATDVALGLRRLPTGFFILLHHGGLQWRTDNKPSSVHHDVVAWNGPIPISLDLSAVIRIEIYASFEFQPMLGSGELLRKLTVTVKELLERSETDSPFVFFSMEEDAVSPCSSIFMTVKREQNTNSSTSKVPGPCWSTPASRSEIEDATDRGHSALLRYRKHGEKQDLQRSIRAFEHALNLCPMDHPSCAVAQSNLAMAELVHFQVEGGDARLEAALRMYHDALTVRPVGHPDRPSTLVHMATVHLVQFQKRKDHSEIQLAQTLLDEVLGGGSSESHARQAASALQKLYVRRNMDLMQPDQEVSAERDATLRSADEYIEQAIAILQERVRSTPTRDNLEALGIALLDRFDRLGELADIENAISMLSDAVDLIPHGHPDRPGCLSNLGSSLQTRFDRLGLLSDLEDAILRFRDAADLTPDGHPDKPCHLSNVGISLKTRFKHLGMLNDLDGAISRFRDAADLTPHGHPDKPSHLNNLGISLSTRFTRLGVLSDLEDAISRLRDVVDLTPHGHPAKSGRVSNLGTSLKARFARLGLLSDLEDSISRYRDAVDLTPNGHPDKPSRLSNLGTSLQARFERLGMLSDLEDAISRLRDAVDLTPQDHPDRPGCLSNLGSSLQTRFERLGLLSDLEDAISRHRDAVDLTPDGHPDKPRHHNNLGNSLQIHFEHLGVLSDLDDAISQLRDAVNLIPHGHPNRPGYLSNIGTSLKTRFERLGLLSDLEDSILRYRDAVDLTPNGHPDKPSRLSNLGTSLQARFERLGVPSDLEDAISRLRDAVDLTPHGHPEKPIYLSNLGSSLHTHFKRLGMLSDLEDAISRLRDAVDLTPDSHLDKPSRLSILGCSLHTRFERLGVLSDLKDAISRLRDAVDLTPDGHPAKSKFLNNLGISLGTRFKHLTVLSDLEEAISRFRGAVDLTPDGHPDKPGFLNNLSVSLGARFDNLGVLGDLEGAILRSRDAVDLTPYGHPDKPRFLSNLGISLEIRFSHLGVHSDLEDAISRLRDAVDFTPHGHPDKPSRLQSLGRCFVSCFEQLGEMTKLEQAISLFSHAAAYPVGPVDHRFSASQQWISYARHVQHPSLLHAYSVALNLIPQLAWIGLSLTHRYQQLAQGVDIVREAAAAALDAGFPNAAVEWLEQGRSIVWGELFQLRSSYEELSSAHPEHARRLRELSAKLDQAGANHEMSLEQTASGLPQVIELSRQLADTQRRLAIERDTLLHEIRRLPGFEYFLRPKRFSQLRASAHAGPVVVLNAANTRCDALIVLAEMDHVIHVPLTGFTYKQSTGLQVIMKDFVREARVGGRATLPPINWESILSLLWTNVVKPVLDALAFSEPVDLSRVFWCPTGPFAFLPIHAAGLYGTRDSQPGRKLSDFHISSYVPTLSILIPSSNPCATPVNDLCLLAVRQPPSDGLNPLRGVGPELDHIRKVIETSPEAQTLFVESSEGTVEEVLRLMKGADWVHFACHGVQDTTDPTRSGLCLANKRPLALRDIVALQRPRGGLAFLSACETAKGDKRLSDEAAHIAAGMLFAGYGGVVGTMWTISDRLAPVVAKDVYEYLFRDGKKPDYREAARALHEAIGRARREGASFNNWIPFIHLGL